MKKRAFAILCVVVMLFSLAVPTFAQEVNYVEDRTATLSETEIASLNARAQTIFDKYALSVGYLLVNAPSGESLGEDVANYWPTVCDNSDCVVFAESDESVYYKLDGVGSTIFSDSDEVAHSKIWGYISGIRESQGFFASINAYYDVVENLVGTYYSDSMTVTDLPFVPSDPNRVTDGVFEDGIVWGTVPDERIVPRVYDKAGLMSDSEVSELETLLDQISEKNQIDVAVATVDRLPDGFTVVEYADDLFDYGGFGIGDSNDGVMLLLAMESRDWYITTCGYAITVFTDAGIDYIGEEIVGDLGNGDYASAFTTYATLCDDFIRQAKEGTPYDINEMPAQKLNIGSYIVVSAIIALPIAFICMAVMKRKMKSIRPQLEASDYFVVDSLNMVDQRDILIDKRITRTLRATSESSSGGGGGGGGSSSHSSSSGSSHGGGGGKF